MQDLLTHCACGSVDVQCIGGLELMIKTMELV